MFIELLIAIFFGIFCGIFTGTIPGIHVNLVAALITSFSTPLLNYFDALTLIVFIIALSVTHTFLDYLPSIFLGAPDPDTALGVLPGHRYLLKGEGMEAVKLTMIGSFGALLISVLFFPFFVWTIKIFYPFLENYIGYILILIVVFMTVKEKNKFWAIVIFLMSGILGLIVLNSNIKNPLFPMLGGLFGVSTLIISLKDDNKIPTQKINLKIKLDKLKTIKALVVGQFSGFVTAVLPGVGASTAAVMGSQLIKKIKNSEFMILLGSVNTVNFVLSIATLYVLNKARNGSIVAVSSLVDKFSANEITVLLCTAVISGCISVFLVIKIGKTFCGLINKVDYKKLAVFVLILISILSFVLSGFIGFHVLITGAAIGIIPVVKKVKRTHAMGCLLMPTIIYLLL